MAISSTLHKGSIQLVGTKVSIRNSKKTDEISSTKEFMFPRDLFEKTKLQRFIEEYKQIDTVSF